MLQRPVLLFNLFDIVNRYFTVVSPGVSGWDTTTLSVGGLHDDTTSVYQIPNPSVTAKSVQQNVLNVLDNTAVCVQRFDCVEMARVLSYHGGYFAAAAAVKHADANAEHNSRIHCKIFSGGTSAIDSGTEIVPEFEERSLNGTDEWKLDLHKIKMDATAEWAEIRLVYLLDDVAYYDPDSFTYWARPFMGGIVDFQKKGFNSIKVIPDHGFNLNEGDGEVELVRIARPSSNLQVNVKNVLEGTDLDVDLKCLQEALSLATPGVCALWGNRTMLTNATRHYENVILDPTSPAFDYPPGVTRRNYKFKFIVPMEI